jgi:DNA-binding transcriptional MerR regulator
LTITLKVLSKSVMKKEHKIFLLEELCTLVEMNKRKIRFYIQKGLVARPEGTGKGAYYTHNHLDQLLTIRKWKEAGLSLERIQELLTGESQVAESGRPIPPLRPKKAGLVEVWSHLHIDDGVELHIEPQRSGLGPDQVRALCREITEQYKRIKGEE